MSSRVAAVLLGLVLALAAASRVPLLAPEVDEPHGWRQAETALMARAFADEGIDLLRPPVAWLGSHKTLVLEFPLPEAVMALVYRALGREHLPAARAVTLAFFLGAAFFLFLLVRELFDAEVALVSTVAFCALPSAIFYSRALHIDPVVLCFSHAAAYCAVRAIERRRLVPVLFASVLAVPALLVKAPAAFAIGLPVALLLATRFDRRIAAALALAALPPILAFAAWRLHAAAINAAAPDLSFVPGFADDFRKHVAGAEWYFGTLAMRLDPSAWKTLARSLYEVVAGPVALGFAALPFLFAPRVARAWSPRALLFLTGWFAAAGLYLLIFFPLNVIHDYYQLPLLAPIALACGVSVALVRREWARWSPRLAVPVALGLVLALVAASALSARQYFRQVDAPRMEASAVARAHTPSDALLITGVEGSDRSDDPRLLVRSRRYGWAVPVGALDPALVERLRALGASHALIVVEDEAPPNVAELAERYPARSFALAAEPWSAWLFELSPAPP